MMLQDEVALRDEIIEISDRIDSILHTINQVYPMESVAGAETKIGSNQEEN